MTTTREPDTIPPVRAVAITGYLTRRGWVRKPFPRDGVGAFEHPRLTDDTGKPLSLLVPTDERLIDYTQAVRDFVAAMGVIDDRPAEEVWKELLAPLRPGPAA